MKILLDHLIQESALTSESFSEIMISAANLLVGIHQLHLNDDMIDKLVVLRMNKRFIERVRSKKVFSSVMFVNIEPDQSAKV